jgi:pyruvate dehydrogenase E1 component alpha subunit
VTKQELINFETRIAEHFNNGKIRAPVHLYYGNEDEMINIFENIRQQDWVFCSWRSHYQCLLKGVPQKEIEKEILEGRSISLCFPEHKIYSSAIVGGVLPVAVGTAMSIKLSKSESKVYCFMGDMTSETGIAHEAIKYSVQHNLPIKFIIEDNGKSVCTDTRKTWNNDMLLYEGFNNDKIYHYKYETKYPHAGAGMRVQF